MSDDWDDVIKDGMRKNSQKAASKSLSKKKEIIRITIPSFLTHANKSKTKFMKINGQNIYNGNLHRFTRAKMVEQLHEYLKPFIHQELKGRDLSRLYPLDISLEVHAPINYGSVSMRKKGLCWNPAKPGYKANWDADNLWIWGKCFNDVLTKEGYIVDDSVDYVTSSGKVSFKKIKDFKNRKLVFVIKKDV